jgi:predicted Zn-dependent protease
VSRKLALAIVPLALLASCTVVNPVTGEREFGWVTPAQEVALGEKHYAPSRQGQGGDYRLDSGLTEYVRSVGARVAAQSNIALPYEFSVLNSSVPNAWALPGGKIAINRGLLWELNSEAELAAVLGHEVVHAAARHGAKSMERGMLLQTVVMASALATRDKQYGQYATMGAGIIAQLITQKYGRDAELQSDYFGTQYMKAAGYDPAAAVDLQQTFVRLSEGRQSGWLQGLFASHPPSQERVQRNQATVAQLGAGGERGTERYRNKLATLLKQKPAYEAYDAGRKALAENNSAEAERLARKAIQLEPRESHFYALLGDIDIGNKRYDQGIKHFSDAQARNDQFFYYPLQLGLARKTTGSVDAAENDLKISVELLPTADAYQALGEIAEGRGNVEQAKQYYAAAANNNSGAGQAAQDALVRLDMPKNPGRYMRLSHGLDSERKIVIQLANTTRHSVGEIQLVIDYVDQTGKIQQIIRQFQGTLPPGTTQRIVTGLGPFPSEDAYRVRIAAAKVIQQ